MVFRSYGTSMFGPQNSSVKHTQLASVSDFVGYTFHHFVHTSAISMWATDSPHRAEGVVPRKDGQINVWTLPIDEEHKGYRVGTNT